MSNVNRYLQGNYARPQPPTSGNRSPAYGHNVSSGASTMEKQRPTNNNLDELDSLLLDLSSRYNSPTPG